MIKTCLSAVQIFARTQAAPADSAAQPRAVLCSPLLGAALGVVLWAAHMMLVGVIEPELEAVILLTLWMTLPAFGPVSGAAHLVTLWITERQLRSDVQKVAGFVVVGLMLLAHWLLLLQLLNQQAIWLLFLAPVAGRIAALVLVSVLSTQSKDVQSEESTSISPTHPAVVLWLVWLVFGLGIGFGVSPLIVLLLVAFAVFWLAQKQPADLFVHAAAMVAVMEVSTLLVLMSGSVNVVY